MIFIGLGSNLGNRTQNITDSLVMLQNRGVGIIRTSSLYESKAWGETDQGDFLNAVAELSFEGNSKELLYILQGIEEDMGRVRTKKWGPRIIDLDILEFKRETMQTKVLMLPHPLYTHRGFVLYPFMELEPNWIPTSSDKPLPYFAESLKEDPPVKVNSLQISG
ncbi:MAG: 2-amino-4-hydroxy-6-hydroxymethyldihydropteridine diphosphokinase [Bacteroidota bacterium]